MLSTESVLLRFSHQNLASAGHRASLSSSGILSKDGTQTSLLRHTYSSSIKHYRFDNKFDKRRCQDYIRQRVSINLDRDPPKPLGPRVFKNPHAWQCDVDEISGVSERRNELPNRKKSKFLLSSPGDSHESSFDRVERILPI